MYEAHLSQLRKVQHDAALSKTQQILDSVQLAQDQYKNAVLTRVQDTLANIKIGNQKAFELPMPKDQLAQFTNKQNIQIKQTGNQVEIKPVPVSQVNHPLSPSQSQQIAISTLSNGLNKQPMGAIVQGNLNRQGQVEFIHSGQRYTVTTAIEQTNKALSLAITEHGNKVLITQIGGQNQQWQLNKTVTIEAGKLNVAGQQLQLPKPLNQISGTFNVELAKPSDIASLNSISPQKAHLAETPSHFNITLATKPETRISIAKTLLIQNGQFELNGQQYQLPKQLQFLTGVFKIEDLQAGTIEISRGGSKHIIPLVPTGKSTATSIPATGQIVQVTDKNSVSKTSVFVSTSLTTEHLKINLGGQNLFLNLQALNAYQTTQPNSNATTVVNNHQVLEQSSLVKQPNSLSLNSSLSLADQNNPLAAFTLNSKEIKLSLPTNRGVVNFQIPISQLVKISNLSQLANTFINELTKIGLKETNHSLSSGNPINTENTVNSTPLNSKDKIANAPLSANTLSHSPINKAGPNIESLVQQLYKSLNLNIKPSLEQIPVLDASLMKLTYPKNPTHSINVELAKNTLSKLINDNIMALPQQPNLERTLNAQSDINSHSLLRALGIPTNQSLNPPPASAHVSNLVSSLLKQVGQIPSLAEVLNELTALNKSPTSNNAPLKNVVANALQQYGVQKSAQEIQQLFSAQQANQNLIARINNSNTPINQIALALQILFTGKATNRQNTTSTPNKLGNNDTAMDNWLKPLAKVISNQQATQLKSAQAQLKDQKEIYTNIPIVVNGQFQNVELAFNYDIAQAPEEQHKGEISKTQLMRFSLKFDMDKLGKMLIKAALIENDLKLSVYTEKASTLTKCEQEITKLRTELAKQEIQLSETQFKQGKIPKNLWAETSIGVQYRV
ncbi:hypothetical protein C2869_13525 [Saccharobesus litoralis]|uniref:Flagellar hook-length control protein-like C-terminal domain-containing protein n=1 Tax=Saccharobesus litoralis TaxID=2172099 RepID=A0A2S0VT55_9ALTE|nr:flagellar hook-length control protein FliK [Saccharobesus litoralis]AWB67395.1 hypothetical protein C2869_13525 [Saccharobesus litoralis]